VKPIKKTNASHKSPTSPKHKQAGKQTHVDFQGMLTEKKKTTKKKKKDQQKIKLNDEVCQILNKKFPL